MLKNIINYLETDSRRVYILLFCVIALLRLPALFNDYWDVDVLATIVQTKEFYAGKIPGIDFSENKHFLYHLIFKASYFLSPTYGWVWVNFFGIIIVYLTSISIYKIGIKIANNYVGIAAGLFYGILISSFNRQFMAVNGEIVYNLPIALGLYLFVCCFQSTDNIKRILYFFGTLIAALLAFGIKFQGLMFAIFIFGFICVYIPYYYKGIKILFPIIIFIILAIAILLFDYYIAGLFVNKLIIKFGITSKLAYSMADVRGFTFFDFIIRFIHRQGMLCIWHFILWIPAFVVLFKFIKNKFKFADLDKSLIITFFIIAYLMVFAGGARMYFHYFMAAYVPASLMAAMCLAEFKSFKKIKDKLILFLLIPACFFFCWNVKDITIKHLYPKAFYNEGKFLYWTRAVLIGTFNDYLLPDKNYLEAVKFIQNNSEKQDDIFVWGDGPYLYYFSERRMGTYNLWPKNGIFSYTTKLKSADDEIIQNGKEEEKKLLQIIIKNNPVLFIDTEENGLSTFNIKLSDSPEIYEYVHSNYELIGNPDKMKVYKLK
jgi:hypothetical protein